MAGNSFGNIFKLSTFGESHGKALGGVIDGCPAGVNIDLDFIEILIREKFLFGKDGETTYIIKDNGNQK